MSLRGRSLPELSTAGSWPVCSGWCPTLPNLAPFQPGVRENPGYNCNAEGEAPRGGVWPPRGNWSPQALRARWAGSRANPVIGPLRGPYGRRTAGWAKASQPPRQMRGRRAPAAVFVSAGGRDNTQGEEEGHADTSRYRCSCDSLLPYGTAARTSEVAATFAPPWGARGTTHALSRLRAANWTAPASPRYPAGATRPN
jgi:hypothetical protein